MQAPIEIKLSHNIDDSKSIDIYNEELLRSNVTVPDCLIIKRYKEKVTDNRTINSSSIWVDWKLTIQLYHLKEGTKYAEIKPEIVNVSGSIFYIDLAYPEEEEQQRKELEGFDELGIEYNDDFKEFEYKLDCKKEGNWKFIINDWEDVKFGNCGDIYPYYIEVHLKEKEIILNFQSLRT